MIDNNNGLITLDHICCILESNSVIIMALSYKKEAKLININNGSGLMVSKTSL